MARFFPDVRCWQAWAPSCDYNAAQLALRCGVSVRQLERQFHQRLGCPPQQWLQGLRMRAAEALLLQGLSVKHTALELGFKQPSHFCRQFKAQFGMPPREYLALHQAPFAPNVALRYEVSAADNR